jgi:GT2 family glycosyltransferase
MRAELSAVVVAWNSGASLSTCIDALRASAAQAERTMEVVVVDNGSSDDSVERARRAGADIVVHNPINAGYGVAAAQGMALASGRWLLLLNPDVVVRGVFLRELLATATSEAADVATLVPDLRFASDPSIVNCRGLEVDEIGVPAEVDAGRQAEPPLGPRPVFGGSSGACLLRADALARVGGIEVCFFAYLEDVDLAWRLQRAGYRALLVPAALAHHEGSASVGEGSPVKAFLVARNRRLLFRLDGPATFRARRWRTVIDLGHAAVTSLSGAGSAPWRGRLDALRLRRYTRFVKASRALAAPIVREPELPPRAGLGETLRRKRSISREMHHAEHHSPGRPR